MSRTDVSMWQAPWPWLALGAVGSASAGVLVGASGDAATWGLAVAGASLAGALFAMHRMTSVLGRPVEEALVAEFDGVVRPQRELREERRRVLRAIKELDFDHAMGKINDGDHQAIRARYAVRFAEVEATLADGVADLHPKLAQELERRATRSAAPGVCASCGTENQPKAKFCQDCGEAL